MDFYPEEVVNGLNRVQMADQPPQINDHIVLSEQVGGVSLAGQDLLSARRQSASSLNGVLVLTRQTWHLILRDNKSDVMCWRWISWEICVKAIKYYNFSNINQEAISVPLWLFFSLQSFLARRERKRRAFPCKQLLKKILFMFFWYVYIFPLSLFFCN